MYSELEDCLGTVKPLPSDVILLTDDFESDGSFIMQHFITQFLKNNGKVLLVNNFQSFNHYHQLCVKAGINLKALRESKRVIVMDLLKELYGSCVENESTVSLSSLFLRSTKSNELKTLYTRMRGYILEMNEDAGCEGVLIIIDNLTPFLHLGFSVNDVTNFLSYCCGMVNSSEIVEKTNCLLVRGTTLEDDDDDVTRSFKYMAAKADLQVQLSGLKTGFSKDVQGTLLVVKEKNVNDRIYQYNFKNLKLKLFPYGTSSAVL